MAINFPNNPAIGDTFTANNTVFTWNGESWSLTQQTYNTTSQNYGPNTQNIDIDISNGNNTRIELNNKYGSQLRLSNIPTNKSSKLSILMERDDTIGEIDIDTSVYKGFTNLYSEFLIDAIIQIFFSPDGKKIFLLDNARLQSGSLSTPWDLNTIDKVASVTTISGCNSLYISDDGLHAYMTNNTSFVHHVILSSAWDITSGNFVTPDENYNTVSQATGLQSVFFRYDETTNSGKSMYILAGNDTIYQYALNTAWSFSDTVSYVFQSFVVSEDTVPRQIYLKPDGNSIFVYGATNDNILEYNLLSQWNIGGAGNGVDNTFNFSPISSTGNTFFFNPNGSELYLSDTTTDKIHKYKIPQQDTWDISAAQYDSFYNMWYHDINPFAVFVSQDGTKMYTCGVTRDFIHYYILQTPWDITSARYQNKEFFIGNTEADVFSMYFTSDGKYFYIVGTSSDTVRMYLMDVPWDISTAKYVDFATISSQESQPWALWFSNDGLNFYILGSNEIVYQFVLDSPWVLGRRNYSGDLDFSYNFGTTYGITLRGLAFTDDGRHMFIYDDDTRIVNQFRLSTPWRVNTATYTGKQIDASNTVGDNGYDITISPDGEHLYIINASTRRVHQYDNNNGEWDLQNYAYDNILFDPFSKSGDNDIKAFRWGKDGYRIYVLGRTNPTILQYNCDIQYDLSSISAAGPSGFLNVGNQEGNATGFMFSDDGSTLFVIGTTNGNIHQYDLTNSWEFGNDFLGSQYSSSISLPNPNEYNGESIYTTPGTYTWTCPVGVYSVSVVCIGGGGGGQSGDSNLSNSGGGGGLGWKNNIPVIPGQDYVVVVGTGGLTGGVAGFNMNGGDSYFIDITTVAGIGAKPVTGGGFVGDGGGNGGNGVSIATTNAASGGGGSGGYIGNGGNGAYNTNTPTAGSGGGGGGGGGSFEDGAGGFGGNVGLYGIGNNGTAGSYAGYSGGNGSVGLGNGTVVSFGGGGRSYDIATTSSTVAAGTSGAVRIVWGRGRTYPYKAYFSDTNIVTTINPFTKIQFKPDGTRLYVMGLYDDTIVEYVLNTPWNLATIDNSKTAVFQEHFRLETNEKNLRSFFINPQGTKLFVHGSDQDDIFQFTMSTPWDITTTTYDNVFAAVFAETVDIGYNYSGSKMYLLEDNGNDIYQYTMATYSPTIIWPENITWENNNTPEIPALGTSTVVELYVSDNGQKIYGLEKIKNSNNPK